MKKNIYFLFSLVAASILTASCSDRAVGLSTAMRNDIVVTAMIGDQPKTKAGAIASDTLTTDNISVFYMKAFESDSSEVIKITGTAPNYSSGKFSKGVDKWTDGNSVPYYWPEGDVKFIAVSCSDGKLPGMRIAMDTLSWKDFQVEASGKTYATQKDYVAAVKTQGGRDGFTVSLKFQHLLSRVSLNMWAPQEKFTHTKKLELVSFRFQKVGVKGTFEYTGTSTSESGFAIENWKNATTGTVGVTADTAGFVEADVNVWGICDSVPKAASLQHPGAKLADTTPWLNVIPGSDVSDTLVVFLKLTSSKDSVYYKYVALEGIPSSAVEKYLPGYEYIYNLKVTGQDDDEGKIKKMKIELEDVTVNPWNGSIAANKETEKEVGDNTLKNIMEKAEIYSTVNLQKDVTLSTTNSSFPINLTNDITLNLNGWNFSVTSASGETSDTVNVFEVGNDMRFLIVNDTTTVEHGHAGQIFNNAISGYPRTLFHIKDAVGSGSKGTVVIRGGKFNFDPTEYIEGTTDTPVADWPKTYYSDSFKDIYGNDKYRKTVISKEGAAEPYVYSVVQTIVDTKE